ncbi:transcription regulator [Paenibacillus terrae HPL-003]|uniref:Transcription regulator n=1 Tax=Paenibacillus terrae (strain HPL-003) TaxID=985665 RepID=G7VP90_PAETH|nr:TetR/AcrR family transcriptional regulator [Paenibacillus terrae]AET60967.1 transcription regulator [Paenibacillus terrae HPL-003]
MSKRAMTDEAKALKAQAILDQAAEMFYSSDYEQIKMSDIAKEMKMSKGILFVYFKTKESLFFNLLCREYEKRLNRLIEIILKSRIRDFDDFKHLLLTELSKLVEHNSLYIRLEAMRTTVLEKNVDAETMLMLKMNLYVQMRRMTTLICEHNALTETEVMDVFQAEASIITGCKLNATLPPEVVDIIEKQGLEGLKRDFKQDVLTTMQSYLEGYRAIHRNAAKD